MTEYEQLLKEKLSYKKGTIGIQVDEVRMTSGKIEERIWINFPIVSVIVPFISTEEIFLVKQYRHAIKNITLEVPAGKVDPNELVVEAARRELIEEIGHKATVKPIYKLVPSPHYSNEVLWVCIATDLKPIKNKIDSDEIQEIMKIPLKQVFEMIDKGEIIDGKTITALLYLKHVGYINGIKLNEKALNQLVRD
jgi:ADP-ribose pyrophosphatase